MAAPVDSARQGTNITTAGTSHAINVGSPVSGTLLVVFVRFAGAPGTVTFTGYTQIASDTSDASDDQTMVFVRKADGAEGATDTLTTGNSVKLAAMAYEVTGAEDPTLNAPAISTVAIGTTAANTANPQSVAPIGAPQDTLYLALAAGDGEVGAYTAAPTNYSNLATANSGTGGAAASNCFLGTASRQLSASSSDDPGVFTHGGHNAGWTAFALAIRPPQPASIDAAPGSFSVSTATPAGVLADRVVDAALGTYSFTGIAADVPAERAINAALGAYSVSGAAADLLTTRLLDAVFGAYAVAGSDAQLQRGFVVDLTPGAYNIAGLAASPVVGRVLDAGLGAYGVSGLDSGLLIGRVLVGSSGSYVVVGFPADLISSGATGFAIVADPGVFAVSGVVADAVASRIIIADNGIFALAGEITDLALARVLLGAPGVYVISGFAATLRLEGQLVFLEPISTGRIGYGEVGAVDRGEQGEISDTVGGVVLEEVQA